MKALVPILLLTLFSTQALAQDGFRLEFYGDEALTSCELAVTSPGLVKVHMLVTGPGALSSVSFKAPKTPCMKNMTWLADIWTQPYMQSYAGTTQGQPSLPGQNPNGGGVDVFFNCVSLPRYIGWIWYSVSGPADPCCSYGPEYGGFSADLPYAPFMYIIAFQACPAYSTPLYDPRMSGKAITINPNQACACSLPVSVRESTWGSVKALYR